MQKKIKCGVKPKPNREVKTNGPYEHIYPWSNGAMWEDYTIEPIEQDWGNPSVTGGNYKFKVGDRVKDVSSGYLKEVKPFQGHPVDYGVVVEVKGSHITVDFEGTESGPLFCRYDEVEKVAGGNNVEHPSHYNHSKIEAIEYIKDSLGPEGFTYYCEGNLKKYAHRFRYKGKPVEDLKKARDYLDWLIETMVEIKE